MNSLVEIKLRKLSYNLAIGGRLYIIFGIWNVAKLVLMLTMDGEIKQLIEEESAYGEISKELFITALVVLCILLSIIILITHLMVGRNAVRFSRGEKNRKRFYFYTSVVALLNLFGLVSYPYGIINGLDTVDDVYIASFIVDVSITFILIDLFCSAIRIEKLSKQRTEEEEVA